LSVSRSRRGWSRTRRVWVIVGAVAVALAIGAIAFAITNKSPTSPPAVLANGNVTPQSNVSVVANCSSAGIIEPATIDLLCGDGTAAATSLSWSQWGSQEALGQGTVNVVNCLPNCASGHDVAYRVTVTLSKPVRTASGTIDFTRIAVSYNGKGPSGTHNAVYQDCYFEPPAQYIPKCPAAG
jgi:hypothetical protein